MADGSVRSLQAVLWDFGDTLADETWMLAPLPGVADWPAAYGRILGGGDLADRWNLGLATAAEVADELAAGLGTPGARVLAHMRRCCGEVVFYPEVMELVAKLSLPQAIVTINSDIFSEIVVPTYALADRFDTIVTSWEEASLSKADLCDIAMSRLPGAVDRASCLLIDNRLENVVEWRGRGGRAWRFQASAPLAAHLFQLVCGERLL
jgi:FMN phosphatase YigB (HAD superfamily)